MTTDTPIRHLQKIRTLVRSGIALLVAGFVLYWVAKPMAKVYLNPDASGSVSTIDGDRRGRIQFVADKLSWLGLGLVVVGAMAWANRSENQEHPCLESNDCPAPGPDSP